MENNKVKNTIALCIFASIIVFLSIISFVETISLELTDSEKQSLKELTSQQQLAINRQLSSMIYNLISTTETISILHTIEEDSDSMVLDYVYSKQATLGYDVAIIADDSGEAFITTGEYANISEFDYFNVALSGDTYATEPYISYATGKEVITVSAPIVVNSKVTGVFALQYTTDYLSALLSELTEEEGHNYILNSDGEIIVSTDPSFSNPDQLKNADFENGSTFDQHVENFKNKVSADAAYSINGNSMFGEYRPIIINDWVLLFEVSQDSLTASVFRIRLIMAIVCFIIIGLGATVILYIVITKNRYSNSLEKIAYYDELTGSPNLEKLKLHMRDRLTNNPSDKYGIVKLDIANFKVINEIYGFDIGDKVLCAIANTGASIKDASFLQARSGVDEFIFFGEGDLVYNLHNDKDNFQSHFKTLVPELEEHNFFFRYGRYYIPRGETDVNDIISKVNIAHSTAKANGERDVCDYDEKYTKKARKDAEITNKMHKALKNKEFKMYLQPKVAVESTEVVGAEALVRWIESDGGMVYPGEFIPLFEQNGFILELDKYMFKSACRQIKSWMESGRKIVHISVNFSRLHLHNLNFVEELSEIVASYNIEPKYLEIELTETIVSDNEEDLKGILKKLKNAGFLVSIDDFGSGYSSLGMLKNFDVDTVKLDRSFFIEVDDEHEYKKANLVVESIVDLAGNLGMYTVAEGIETENQIALLKDISCNAVQGYYYSKPLPIDEFENFCAKPKN